MKRRISEILSASTGVLKQVAALTAAVFVFAAAFAAPSFAASSYDNLAVANVKNEPLNMRTSLLLMQKSSENATVAPEERFLTGKTAGQGSALAGLRAG